ncbi:MAG: hypothetical protein A4S17_02780 [Proteobacteria bacterium HN_bin10]|jgi:hypothetical protein|nr:MAG: hypothetical protein A4S17_02780 [Proteobacteria bacterium HN_bin10]
MNRKWVDNEVYFGPDRRKGGPGKRWGDRRVYDDAGQAPPLGAVMRRLRVQLSDTSRPEDRRRIYELARFAASEAERQHFPACADPLREALTRINQGDYAGADEFVTRAQAVFNGAR